MGLTYKAFDRNLLSLAVVKVIAPEHMGRPEARQRFLQEAQSMAKIKHPNVADVFFLGDSPHGVFYAMEFCDGPSVQEFIEENGPLKPADVLILGHQSALALQAVERHNLIHRDIKPSNMILVNDAQGRSQIKLIDFGLARDVLRDPNLSQGGFVGTPTFASPEQLLEQTDLDIRSDIYSLGITLWFMLSGRPPFGGSQFEVMFHHVNTPPPWDRLPAMPESARQLLNRMMQKSAEERIQTPEELAHEFQHIIDSEGFSSMASARLSFGPREMTGSVLGMSSFEILSEATEGDLTGKVFRARDAHDGRIVSLKYLHPGIAAKPAVLGKIQRQVLSLRPLQHPHLVQVLGFEKSEDGAKIIAEWVTGPSLLALLKARNQLTLSEAAPLLGQLAGALDFAAAQGLGTVETDLHQILLTSPSWGEDPLSWARHLRQPVDTWQDVALKVNPLRLSPAEQDYPTMTPSGKPDPSAGGPRPLLGAFLQLAYRLLGGAGGSHSSSRGGGFVSIPGLGAEANDLIESFGLPPFTEEKRSATCASVLRELCGTENVAEPEIFEVPPEPEDDLMMTRDATLQASSGSASLPPPFPTTGTKGPSSVPPAWPTSHPTTGATQSGSQSRTGTRFGSAAGSQAGRISADYDIKRKELDLQRQRLESEAERLKQEEILEATRAMLDEERFALAEAREEFARQERDRAQRAEQDRRKLEEERLRLESKTLEVDTKRREQERLEQEIQLRAQFEFQKFEDERRKREAEWVRQREEIELSLKEREEQSLVREQQSFKKLREERERLKELQTSLEQGKAKSQQEAEAAQRQQVAALEAERQDLADQQAELERRLLAQSQELAQLREKFDAAEQEIEARYQRLAAEESAAAARHGTEMEEQRQRLAEERDQLESQRSAFEAERAGGAAATALSDQQREENAAALARLAAEETRLSTERSAFENQRSQRESALAAELAQAKRELEEERAALAQEADRARQSGMAELEAERESIAATRAGLAAQEAALATQVEEKVRELETSLALQRSELESEREALAAHRARLDAEHQRLTLSFTSEKEALIEEVRERHEREEAEHRLLMEQRVQELGRIEQEEQTRLAALRQEISHEESRLQAQRQEVFSQERLIARMDQEADYQDEETREKLEAEQLRLEGQRGEIEQKLQELQKAHKKRLITIVAGTIIAVSAASTAGYIIKGRLVDPAKLRGQEAWVQFERERRAGLTEGDWPQLLNWSVVTDERFQNQETDPVIRNFYKEKRSAVIEDARKAVDGLLDDLAKGWKPPAADSEEFKKLRQNLAVVARMDGIPNERLLVLAKLDLPYLTARGNSGEALRTYAATISADPKFIPRLQPELSVTVQGMLDDYLADHALNHRDELAAQLRDLPDAAQESVPRIKLLLALLEAEAARTGPPDAENLAAALKAVNDPMINAGSREFFAKDPEWAKILRPEVDRILATVKSHPEVILPLKDVLSATAEQWKTDDPWLMLADAAELTQQKLDFYKAAEKLTGNPEARARVAGYYLQQASLLMKTGQETEARQLLNEAMPRIQETADKGEPEAMALLSDVLRQGLSGTKDLDGAIRWAEKARTAGHPDADFSLGLCYLEKAEDLGDPALVRQAEAAFLAATRQESSPNAPRAWYFLANTYSQLNDPVKLVDALEKGAQLRDPDCLYMLGQCLMAGPPYYKTANLTLGRDHLTEAARLGHARAIAYLREESARVWEKSGLPADRDWIRKNADLLQEKSPP